MCLKEYVLQSFQHITGFRECSCISIYYFLKLATFYFSEYKLHNEVMMSL
jgi:hypothetical protein